MTEEMELAADRDAEAEEAAEDSEEDTDEAELDV